MPAITISKKIIKNDDLVTIPRKEYEELLGLGRTKEISMTQTEKKALTRAMKNYREGKLLAVHELKRKLERLY